MGLWGFGSLKALVTSCGQIMATKVPKEFPKIGGLVRDGPRPKKKPNIQAFRLKELLKICPGST